MAHLEVYVGISGSGKSTEARKKLLSYGGSDNAVIIGRDKIRELLFGLTEATVDSYYRSPDLSANEHEVGNYMSTLIRYSLQKGKVVIIDNTNLRMKYIREYYKFGVPVNFNLVDTPFDVCVERDADRVRKVGKTVIAKQHQDLLRLKSEFNFKPWYPTTFQAPPHDKNKENCVIFDIDGTLADHTGVRGPFDWSKVMNDSLKKDIAALYMICKQHQYQHDTPKVIICSGRDGSCKKETIEWLHYYGLNFDNIYIRAENDCRPDYEIKQEFWEEISAKYNVLFMVDDRNQVVDHARRLGYTVLQVAEGDF